VTEGTAFADATALGGWLRHNHATETELWVRLYRKGTGTPSVTWEVCVVQSLAWGWIDGLKRPFDDTSWLQRLTPRKKGSSWSARNRAHAERLIAEGAMSPAGLVHVERARADGRWEATYAGQAAMEIPADFLAAVGADPLAKATFDSLNRANLFAIYYRLVSAKSAKTRQARMEWLLAMLARGERIHG